MFDYSGFKTVLKEVIFWSNYVSDNSEKRLQWAQKRDDSFAAALRLLEQTKNQFLHRHCSKPTFLARNSTFEKIEDVRILTLKLVKNILKVLFQNLIFWSLFFWRIKNIHEFWCKNSNMHKLLLKSNYWTKIMVWFCEIFSKLR